MATWTVNLGDSIQAAIDAASDGDRIEIAAGSYAEELDVGAKSLTLVGAGMSATTLGDTHLPTCLAAAGGDLVLESLAIAGCDTLLSGSGGTWTFTDVELWGSANPGTVEGVTWTWTGGGFSLLEGPLSVADATLSWSDLSIADSSSTSSLVSLTDCTTTFDTVEAADNTLTDWPVGILNVNGGTFDAAFLEMHDDDATSAYSVYNGIYGLDADITLTDCDIHDNPSTMLNVQGSLTTERCTFTDNADTTIDQIGFELLSWTSTDDVFTTSTAGTRAAYVNTLVMSGTVFTGYDDADTVLSVGNYYGGSFDISGITVDGGILSFLYVDGTIDGSTFSGQQAIATSVADLTLTNSTFTGTSGVAVVVSSGDFIGEDLTFTGYDTVVQGCFASLTRVDATGVGTLGDFTGCDLVLDDVSIDAREGGMSLLEGSVSLTDVDVAAGGEGLELGAESTLTNVTVDAGGSGITLGRGDITASNVDIVAGVHGLVGYSATVRTITGSIDDLTLDAASDGIHVTSSVTFDVAISNATIDAGASAIASDGGGTLTLDTVAFTGTDGIATAGIIGTDVTLDSDGEGVSGTYIEWHGGSIWAVGAGVDANWVILSDVALTAGADGIYGWETTLTDVTIDAGGGCVEAGRSSTLTRVDCVAGAVPLLFPGGVTMEDVAVHDSVGTSSIDVFATLTDVRFVDVAADQAPLVIDGASVTATGLNFQRNTGVDAGALVVSDSTGSVTGAVFHGNTATDGPGAALDSSGIDWDCVAFVGNRGTAGDLTLEEPAVLDHVTLSGSDAMTGAIEVAAPYFSLSSSVVTAGTAAGVYGDADVRTNFVTWTDVWGNAGGDWAGGIPDPTGTNGNISADPLLDANLDPGSGSPVIDAGNPLDPDPDGTPSDMGARSAVCAELDLDGDGQRVSEGDCDDGDDAVASGAEEIPCDELDNDCAGDGDDPDCEDSGDADTDTDTDADSDADSDADTDTDADSDADADADADSDADSDPGVKDEPGCGCSGLRAEALAPVLFLFGRRRR